jgi:hypothetical protein
MSKDEAAEFESIFSPDDTDLVTDTSKLSLTVETNTSFTNKDLISVLNQVSLSKIKPEAEFAAKILANMLEKEYFKPLYCFVSSLTDAFRQCCDRANKVKSDNLRAIKLEKEWMWNCVDEAEKQAIRHHAGWAVKRARDGILSSSVPFSIKRSKDDSTSTTVSKECLLNLLKKMGTDHRQDSGKFLFIINDTLLDFFIVLHKCLLIWKPGWPIKRNSPVSEISLCSYFYSKKYCAFTWTNRLFQLLRYRLKEARSRLLGWKFFHINSHKRASPVAGMKEQRYCRKLFLTTVKTMSKV